MNIMKKLRYNFYSHVHRYVRYEMFELSKNMAKIDFRDKLQAISAKEQFDKFKLLMKGHATHEDTTVHQLFREANSTVFQLAETEHKTHDQIIEKMADKLNETLASDCDHTRHLAGYQFYLLLNKFIAESLNHLNLEEQVLMADLHQLYPDEKIRAVTFNTYDHMRPEQLLHMLQTIFPHVNDYEREVFIRDIHESYPKKLKDIWPDVWALLSDNERQYYQESLGLKKPISAQSVTQRLHYKWQKHDDGSALAETYHLDLVEDQDGSNLDKRY